MRSISLYIFLLLLYGLCTNCQQLGLKDPDFRTLPPIVDGDLQAVIEIPAGTNHKIEYNYETGRFENDQLDGRDRVIRFLPYPGNYGFIPGTLLDKSRGGDGDALDIIVLGEAVASGTVLRVRPIGAMVLEDHGERDTKIVAVPAVPDAVNLGVDNFLDFAVNYDAARRILEDWFTHYKGSGRVKFLRWEDENFAWQAVRKWSVVQSAN
ncbi:MAG: inorganic diphosphatase [Bacteroidetes bacterium]|nr:MAG: inorganic diphosphatase [Bacteroidota bacterium]